MCELNSDFLKKFFRRDFIFGKSDAGHSSFLGTDVPVRTGGSFPKHEIFIEQNEGGGWDVFIEGLPLFTADSKEDLRQKWRTYENNREEFYLGFSQFMSVFLHERIEARPNLSYVFYEDEDVKLWRSYKAQRDDGLYIIDTSAYNVVN